MVVQYVATDLGKLAVEINGSGPLVLCAPALGDSRDAYAPLSAQLVSAGYTVARMDVRGHGDSSTLFTSYGDLATAEDFITVLEELKLGPAVLVGASFAGGSATIAAARRPDLVRGIVLLGAFMRLSMGVTGLVMTKAMVAKPWGPMVWKSYSKTLCPGLGSEGAAERAAYCSGLLARPGRWWAFQATIKGADHRVVEPFLPKVKSIPALVVMGEKDPDWSKPVEEAQWIGSNFEKSTVLTIPETGHAPHLEKPDVVGPAVLTFLGSLKQ